MISITDKDDYLYDFFPNYHKKDKLTKEKLTRIHYETNYMILFIFEDKSTFVIKRVTSRRLTYILYVGS